MKGLWHRRSFQYGAGTVWLAVIAVVIAVAINYLASQERRRLDLTEGKLYSLSGQTVKVLKNLEMEIKVTGFFREGSEGRIRDLLTEFRYHSDKVSFTFVDPDKNPAMARRYGIRVYDTTVFEAGDREEKVNGQDEKSLANALVKVTREKKKVLYFTEGHGEGQTDVIAKDGFSIVRDRCRDLNYEVKTLVIAQEGTIPENCEVLLVLGPKTAFLESETKLVRGYLKAGGKALFMLDPGQGAGLEDLVKEWHINLGDDFVVDASGIGSLFGVDYSMPIAAEYGVHDITEQHEGVMTLYPLARSVRIDEDNLPAGWQGRDLMKTSQRAWAETDLTPLRAPSAQPEYDPDVDQIGPVPMAAAIMAPVGDDASLATGEEGQVESKRKTRLVVFGDSEFANNQFFDIQGNGDLFMNSVNWLAEEEDLIDIQPKTAGYNPIALRGRDGTVIAWLSLVALPFAVLLSGIGVWWWRRR